MPSFSARRLTPAGALFITVCLGTHPLFAQEIQVRPAEQQQEGSGTALAATTPLIASGSVPVSTSDRLRPLLQRPEVQTHLKLTVRQKEQLGLNPKARGRSNGADGGPGAPPPPDDLLGSSGRVSIILSPDEAGADTTPEERKKKADAAVARLRDQLAAASEANAAKIKEVLTPAQYARLLQLDLQKRGPFALGDPEVAEQVQIEPAKRAQITALAADAQRRIGAVMSEALQARLAPSRAGSSGSSNGPNFRVIPRAQVEQFQRDMKNRLSPTRQNADKIRREAEEQILAQLSPEERTRWQESQGEPFSFRTDQ
jgi:hypothetical protein